MSEENKTLRSYQILIKKGHKMFDYFDSLSLLSKNLYNTTNFYIRQVFTGVKKDSKKITQNEKEVIETINSNITKLNAVKQNYYEKRINNNKDKNVKKEIKEPKFFKPVTEDNSFPCYELLEGVLKVIKQVDYTSLPSHSNQHIIKQLYQNYNSFFKSLKEYKLNPSKFKGRPRIPKYAPKNGRKPVVFSNQTCIIKNNKIKKRGKKI